MASIKNVTLKNVITAMGTEGPFSQGNIYLNNKNVGFFSQSGDGGCGYVNIEDKEHDNEIQKITKEYFTENPPEFNFANTDEYLFEEILSLLECEKEFKKQIKKGYTAIVSVDATYKPGILCPAPQIYSVTNHYLEGGVKYQKFMDELKVKGYNQIKFYKSLNDFIIK